MQFYIDSRFQPDAMWVIAMTFLPLCGLFLNDGYSFLISFYMWIPSLPRLGMVVSLFPMVLFLTPLIVHLTLGGFKPRKQRMANAVKELAREDFCSLLVRMLMV